MGPKDRPPFSSSMVLLYVSSLFAYPHHLPQIVQSLLTLPLFPSKTQIFAVAKAAKFRLPNLALSTAKGLQVRICSWLSCKMFSLLRKFCSSFCFGLDPCSCFSSLFSSTST